MNPHTDKETGKGHAKHGGPKAGDARHPSHPKLKKDHPHHADAIMVNGKADLSELKAGTAYWMGKLRSGEYSIKLFDETAIDAKTTVLVLVRHKGAPAVPSAYDLDKIEAGLSDWFEAIEAGAATITVAEEHAIDADDDLLMLVRVMN